MLGAMLSPRPREEPAEGRSPEGEGANIDRRLVPYLFIYSSLFNPSPGAKRQLKAEGLRAKVLISTGI